MYREVQPFFAFHKLDAIGNGKLPTKRSLATSHKLENTKTTNIDKENGEAVIGAWQCMLMNICPSLMAHLVSMKPLLAFLLSS